MHRSALIGGSAHLREQLDVALLVRLVRVVERHHESSRVQRAQGSHLGLDGAHVRVHALHPLHPRRRQLRLGHRPGGGRASVLCVVAIACSKRSRSEIRDASLQQLPEVSSIARLLLRIACASMLNTKSACSATSHQQPCRVAAAAAAANVPPNQAHLEQRNVRLVVMCRSQGCGAEPELPQLVEARRQVPVRHAGTVRRRARDTLTTANLASLAFCRSRAARKVVGNCVRCTLLSSMLVWLTNRW